jgi:hypothetical protein
MSVRVEDVKMWAIERGFGHAVATSQGYWIHTACGDFANFPMSEDRPKRVCRQCRAVLRGATHATGATP